MGPSPRGGIRTPIGGWVRGDGVEEENTAEYGQPKSKLYLPLHIDLSFFGLVLE
jgi:hypothetical protein